MGIQGIISNEYSWQFKGNTNTAGAQIDLLIDRNDNCINLIEAKFHAAIFEMSKAEAAQIEEKINVFKSQTRTQKNIFLTLITAAGTRKNEHFLNVVTNELTIESLF